MSGYQYQDTLDAVMVFFFNDTATTEIYTLSLHDALPIFARDRREQVRRRLHRFDDTHHATLVYRLAHLGQLDIHHVAKLLLREDRKSTRLNSSHANISYAVFCLKKKHNYSRRIERAYERISVSGYVGCGDGFFF